MATLKSLFIAIAVSILAHLAILALVWMPDVVSGSRAAKPALMLVKIKPATPQTTGKLEGRQEIQPAAGNEGKLAESGVVPEYSRSGELTEQPALLDTMLEIPTVPSAMMATSRSIIVRVIVGVNGKVLLLQVLESSVPRSTEEEIVRAIYGANYKPGRVGKRLVNAELTLSIDVDSDLPTATP